MNPKQLVKVSNIIGLISIIALIYWIFIFISIEVFGLKVFKQNITDTFYISIIGILALMFGALMINIMFNLTRIAEKQNADNTYKSRSVKRLALPFLLSFPIIFGALVAGDYYTAYTKEKAMIRAAETIIVENKEKADQIANYTFTKQWIRNTNKELSRLSKLDTHFPSVAVIVKDTLDKYNVYLRFDDYTYFRNDSIIPDKQGLIRATTQVERDYLKQVFNNNLTEKRFSKHRGNYELFYPYTSNNKTVVFYFSDYQQYGKVAYDSYSSVEVPTEAITMDPMAIEADSTTIVTTN